MKRSIIQNFRGARALVIHVPDENRKRLVAVLQRLGLLVGVLDSAESDVALQETLDSCDILFFETDQGVGPILDGLILPAVPLVAVIGVEAPSRLSRVIRARAAGYITKPIRSTGIFTTLFLAFNEFAQRQTLADERGELEERLRARRFVTKAILKVMAAQNVDDDEAFRRLRRESMSRRVSVEALCEQIVSETTVETSKDQAGDPTGPPAPPAQPVQRKNYK
ncbi:ANTAR domain-containing response regulator [Algihabitans albus]|uniref:ANTAR domain-containing response regulator n=1 Tax=Algihabitans albus TaxID=2164067 RepID=UPI000E5D130F|nr:ANTAR domain-containing protein [Algihabitans albus]